MIYLVDIDGTVADISHRLHFIQNEPKLWDEFYKACVDDAPIPEVIEVVQALGTINVLLFITGRSEDIRKKTEEWLDKHNIPWEALLMRAKGDHREDSVVKSELLDEALKRYSDPVIAGAFEDRQQVVDMYRKRGIRVFQVAPGNF